MKIAIIGATGGTGGYFLELATEAGHDVAALARTVEKLAGWADRIRVVHADGRDAYSLDAALDSDIEAVVNIVGASNLSQARKVTDLYSVTTKNLIAVPGVPTSATTRPSAEATSPTSSSERARNAANGPARWSPCPSSGAWNRCQHPAGSGSTFQNVTSA